MDLPMHHGLWNLRVVDELNKLNAKVSSYDKALFFWA